MVKNLPPPNTRSSKMRNLTFRSNLGTISYNFTSSKKLEAVTNLRALRFDPDDPFLNGIIRLVWYFNVLNINDIKFVTIKWKPVTQSYPVSFKSNNLFVIENNIMSYDINVSVFKDDNGNNSFGTGLGYKWEIQVTYTMNNGEESEMASIVSDFGERQEDGLLAFASLRTGR